MPNTGTWPSSSRVARTPWPTVAGSPGPLDSITPSGRQARASAAGVAAGTTSTLAPSRRSRRAMLALAPKSYSTTRCRSSPSAGSSTGSALVTRSTMARPLGSGAARASSRRAPASATSVETAPRMAPRWRRCRTSRRVSRPSTPGTPAASSSSARLRSARQLEGRRAAWRTRKAATWTLSDSASAWVVP